MRPRLDILPTEQQRLWPELSQVPEHFVLYGGTAVALRLGGRQSIDFDFFTNQPISADGLGRSLAFLQGAELIQSEPNTSTFTVDRGGVIKVPEFNPVLSLKALAYYGEPTLATVPINVREFLTEESAKVESVKIVPRIAPHISPF
jgi:hypothetical protein